MRILLISQWFEPEPTFKGLTFARELRRRGHEVEVLTGFPNYPGGNLYPGYRIQLWQREYMEGIPVLRVPLYPSHSRSSIGRMLNYVSFAISASIASVFFRRPDVIYAYQPPATVGLPALIAKMLHRVPIVYDIQDLWPDTVAATGMMKNRILLNVLSRWCNHVYRQADRLVVLSPGFKTTLAARGISPDKIEVIYNWCDENAIGSDCGSQNSKPDNRFNVLFAGTMGLAQALDSVLKAAQICATAVPRAQFVFVGGGVDKDRLKLKSAEMKLTNVEFRPRLPMDQMGHVLSTADALLVHLKDDPLFRITIPSKTQAYLAAGRPIVMAVSGDAATLVQRSGGGIVCAPEDPQGIASAICELAAASSSELKKVGDAGRSFYFRELSLSAGVDSFERVFASCCQDLSPQNC